jgi:hypothetical protein
VAIAGRFYDDSESRARQILHIGAVTWVMQGELRQRGDDERLTPVGPGIGPGTGPLIGA